MRFTAFAQAKLAENKSALFLYNRYGTAIRAIELKDFATKEDLLKYAYKKSLEELSDYACSSI